MKKPRILFFDIETRSIKGDSWVKYDTNLIYIREYTEILCFAYKWQGEKTIYFEGRQKQSEKSLLKKLHKVLDKADIVIGQNSDKFDVKKVFGRFFIHGLAKPRPFQTVDTLKQFKKHFGLDSNSLDDVARMLGIGRKMPHQGYDMWLGCEKNDPKAWKQMERYNRHDVRLLEEVYLKLRPWIENHPNVALISGVKDGCPNCGSERLYKNGVRRTLTQEYHRYQCQDCGATAKGKKVG